MSASRIWNSLDRPELGLSNAISDLVASLERSNPDLLTDLRHGPALIVTCDYSGQHKKATHESYTFLVADLIFTWLWDEMRRETRRTILRDNRRMSFKALNDSRRRQALVPFLRAANTVPGLLFTVMIDKTIGTIFKFDRGALEEFPELMKWQPHTVERFLRMAHIGSLLLSCLSSEMQDVSWFTDEDDIVANPQRIIDGTRAVATITSHYLKHTLGHLRYGSTKSDDGSLFIEDLAAIADLVAGALNEMFSRDMVPHSRGTTIPLSVQLSSKTRCIAGWLADAQLHTLKRIVLALDAGEGQSIQSRAVTFYTAEPIPEYMWRSDFLRIARKP